MAIFRRLVCFFFSPAIAHDDSVVRWRLNAFYILVSATLFFAALPLLLLFTLLHWWEMIALGGGVVVLLASLLFFIRQGRLCATVYGYLAGVYATIFYFTLVTHRLDAALLFPFLVLFAGIFLGVRHALGWLLCTGGVLVFILHQITSTVFSSLSPREMASMPAIGAALSLFALTCTGMLLSVLFKHYVLELLRTLSQRNTLLEEAVAQREKAESQVRELNKRLRRRVQESTRELRRSQEELRQSEKMRVIGQLAGGIAHDFNNHLTGIIACADMIRSAKTTDEPTRGHAETIMGAARQASRLTQQLLAYARKGNFLSIPLDIHDVLSQVCAMLERSLDKRIRLKVNPAAPCSIVKGDPDQFHNAFLNLALNARDAMPAGGELCFSTTTVTPDPDLCARLKLRKGCREFVRIDVSDTGTGIDPEHHERIFEPFYTTKPRGNGTGMGLAAVYGSIRAHGGGLDFETAAGAGTTFSLYLPLCREPLQHKSGHVGNRTPLPLSARARGHILVIDDEEIVRAALSRLLQSQGYTVTSFADGQRALAWYDTHHGDVDLVILDMIMPVLDGYEVRTRLLEVTPARPVLLVSGFSLDKKAQQFLRGKRTRFVAKPCEPARLLEAVADLMHMRHTKGDADHGST